jgi:hypothetical protein
VDEALAQITDAVIPSDRLDKRAIGVAKRPAARASGAVRLMRIGRLLPWMTVLTMGLAQAQGPPAEPLEFERDGYSYRCEPRLVEGDYFNRFDLLTVSLSGTPDGPVGKVIIGELEYTLDGTPLGTGLQERDLDGDDEPELVVWTFTAGNDVTGSSGLTVLRPTPEGLETLYSALGAGPLPVDLDYDGVFEIIAFGSWWPVHLGRAARVEFADQIWVYDGDVYTPAPLDDFQDVYLDMADTHTDRLLSLQGEDDPAATALAYHAAGVLLHLALGGLDEEYDLTWARYVEELQPAISEGDPEGWVELEDFFGTGPGNVRLALTPALTPVRRVVAEVEFYADSGYYRVDALDDGSGGFASLELYYIDDSQQDFVDWHLVDTLELACPAGTTLRAEDVDENGRPDVVLEFPEVDGGPPLVLLNVGLDGFSELNR